MNMSHSIMKIYCAFFKNKEKHFAGSYSHITEYMVHFQKTIKVEYELTTGMPKSILRLCLQV